MKKFITISLIAIIVDCIFACTHPRQIGIVAKTVDSNSNNGNTQEQDQVDTSVCFQRDVLPIFTAYCAMSGCHDAISSKNGYILTSYSTIVLKGLVKGNASGSKLYKECINGKMPKSPIPHLDSTQLSFISRWINMGAPNDTNCAVNCDTTKFTYSAAIVPILRNYCYSCHSTASASSSGGGTILDTYSGLLAQAQNGKLLSDLQHSSGSNFMPLGAEQLSSCKIRQVEKWIAAGSQNN